MITVKRDLNWQGRIDTEDAERGLRWHQVVNNESTFASSCSLIGFACDLGVKANKGREGAALGPTAIRSALANMAWQAPTDLLDKGDVIDEDSLESAQQEFANLLNETLDESSFVVGLGGGHEIAWASYLGLRQRYKKNETSFQCLQEKQFLLIVI